MQETKLTTSPASGTQDAIEISMRCKPFSYNMKMKEHHLLVDADGTIRVYDSIAGHYTTCHRLGKAARAKAIRLAQEGGR